MKTTILTLEPHDDLISIRDKLAWAKSPRILLVWPKRRRRNVEAPLYLSRLELTLLVRQARQLGAQLALVTANAQVRAYAAEAGVAVFDTVEEAQEASWRRKRRRSIRNIRRIIQAEKAELSQASLETGQDWRAGRNKLFQPAQATWLKKKYFRIAVFSFGVIAVLAIAMLYLPAAQVQLALAERPQQVRLEVWANPEVPQALVTGALPVQTVSVIVEGQQQIPSSGSIVIPENYAAGQVLFTNMTESPVSLPVGTVLRTLDAVPQRFELVSAVQVPPGVAQMAQGNIRALQPGPEANIATHTIRSLEGSLGALVSVDNPEALTGGSERLAPAPTEADYAQLQQILMESLRQTAREELSVGLSEGDLLISDSLEIKDIQFEQRTPAEGTAGDVLILTMRAEFTAWVVQRQDIEQVAVMALEATMPRDFDGSVDTLNLQLEQDFSIQGARAVAVLSADWQVHSSITSWQVVQAVIGRNPQAAAQSLQAMLALAEPPIITLSPPWWPSLPLLPSQIQVVVVKDIP